MSNVLIVSGHPRTSDDSVANKTILEELASLMPGVEIDHLDELYPDYVFDVEAEQSKLAAADVSKVTRMLGRVWAYATLAQRGASMLGFLPYFDGQDVLSAQQGSYTTLFTVQLTLEMIALLAAIVSYVWMVRYLWRVRTLLRGEAV